MVRPITVAESVLAVYCENEGRVSRPPTMILLAWPDGHVVWSRDRLRGGPPYYTSDVDPRTITSALARFEADGLFAAPSLNRFNGGSDSPFTVILLRSGGKQLQMASWHELVEARGDFDTSRGIMRPGHDRTRAVELADEPAWFLHFLFFWSEIRHRLDALIPASGKETSGALAMRVGNLSWQEL